MITTTYNKIYAKLRDNFVLRGNDRLLQLSIWRDEGLILTPEQERKFMSITAPETIRRTRQKVQEDGHFPAATNVREARKENEYQVKNEVMKDRLVQSAIPWFHQDD